MEELLKIVSGSEVFIFDDEQFRKYIFNLIGREHYSLSDFSIELLKEHLAYDDYVNFLEDNVKNDFERFYDNLEEFFNKRIDKEDFYKFLKLHILKSKFFIEDKMRHNHQYVHITSKIINKHYTNLYEKVDYEVTKFDNIADFEWIRYFKTKRTYLQFLTYCDNFIFDAYMDFSYLFQRLKKEKLIHKVSHKDFAKYLLEIQKINDPDYQRMFENGFETIINSGKTERVLQFNKIFIE